ncbi:hypothetical protein [Bradyrhizobium erythrophlei]|uniref:Uncharacterized protein n=1 Tax=Bradyrhizobium erythrophlei TaxID=1437360 RepID=A0A1M7UVE7_9BRAD|nr:hypothetical protein [Bradyrhizobium erythrophlei]SHN86905.1 hypothetical protein SAMN05444170_6906 [Bradyrhizobium erythrophlei]
MSAPTSLVLLYVAALAAIAVLGIAVYRTTATSAERRLQFQTSLLIQLLGSIVFGAIVTYSIYVIEHAQQAEEKHLDDLKLAADNKARVLRFIKDELSYDLAALQARDGSIGKIQQQPLKSDFWRIAGLSGDLKWVDDLDALNLIAQAYFGIDQSSAWEVRYLDATLGVTSTISMTVNGGPQVPLKQFMLTLMVPGYATAQSAINSALKKL